MDHKEEMEQAIKQGNVTIMDSHHTKLHRLVKEKDAIKLVSFSEMRGLTAFAPSPLRKKATFYNVFCEQCGKYIDYYFEHNLLIPSDLTCYHEETVSVTIPVPSGKLMFNDCFRHEYVVELYDLLDEGDLINTLKGRMERVKTYASAGIGHFFVGNRSPQVFEKDGQFTIGKYTYIQTKDGEMEEPPIEGGKDIGYVCTDLWWVSICDPDVFKQLFVPEYGEDAATEMIENVLENADIVIDVEPGMYTLTYHGANIDDDTTIFATLTRQ